MLNPDSPVTLSNESTLQRCCSTATSSVKLHCPMMCARATRIAGQWLPHFSHCGILPWHQSVFDIGCCGVSATNVNRKNNQPGSHQDHSCKDDQIRRIAHSEATRLTKRIKVPMQVRVVEPMSSSPPKKEYAFSFVPTLLRALEIEAKAWTIIPFHKSSVVL